MLPPSYMSVLDSLVPAPRLLENDEIELELPLTEAWRVVRHADLARSGIVRALFAIREIPGRLKGHREGAPTLGLDELVSTPSRPGFQALLEDPPRAVAVGAIGKVWMPDIPFVHVDDAAAFLGFDEPGYVKVAWALKLWARDAHHTMLAVEVRVDTTDEESYRKFRRYFRIIGPASRFIRHSLLTGLARDYGRPESREDERALPGDELLGENAHQLTHAITIHAPPEAVWPWLVQMGCRRAGFYSWDLLDNGGTSSAKEIHPDLQDLRVGDTVAATPGGDDGFEVLELDAPRSLVLGGLYDVAAGKQIPFDGVRPARYWHVTWSFALEPLDDYRTRLRVRARATCPPNERLHLSWIRFAHHFMEPAQLRHIAARAEGRLRRDGWRDVLDGVSGTAIIAAALATPPWRGRRAHWGLSEADANRPHPGDELVPSPTWGWTHGVEIAVPAERVWPWVAQIGANKAGFYSYQALENLAGCNVRNAETVHHEWEARPGGELRLHPKMPPLSIVAMERGRYFVALAPVDESARAEGRPWAAASWLFFVEPLGPARCRVVSRYRVQCSEHLVSRLSYGAMLLEPIGFAMDRRMLLGIRARAEGAEKGSCPKPGRAAQA